MFLGYYYPSIGGVQKIVSELSTRLTESGYTITIITCNSENVATYEKKDGLEIIRFPCWDILNKTYPIPKPTVLSMKIISRLLMTDFHLVITHTRFYPLCLLGMIIAKIKKIPFIHMEHGSQYIISQNLLVSLLGRIYDHSFGFLIIRFANQNICISNKTMDFVRHLGGRTSIVIHNGIDLSKYIGSKEEVSESPPDIVTITYLGRLIFAKGVQDLISIVPEIKNNFKLLIIGDGPYKPELLRLAQKTDRTKIIFLGEKQYNEIPQLLTNTDIFVNPSYSEGFPTSVVEACAAGCAVIATDVGGTNEIIQEGITGFLIPPGDQQALIEKINFLVENGTMRGTLGKNAHDYIRNNFSWDEILPLWINEINHLWKTDV